MEMFEPVVNTTVTVSDLSLSVETVSETEKTISKKEKKISEKKRLRHTNYVIMVNTNKPFADWDDPDMHECVAKLKKQLEEFGTTKVIKSIIVFKKEGHEWTNEYIKHVAPINPVIERGEKKGCIHAHFKLNIDHWSCIHVDYAKIKSFFNEALPGVHVHIKRYYSDKDVDEYNNKNVPKVSVAITESTL